MLQKTDCVAYRCSPDCTTNENEKSLAWYVCRMVLKKEGKESKIVPGGCHLHCTDFINSSLFVS